MTLSYDKRADVLYVTFEKAPPETYEYVENESGDILRLSKEDQRVVGCTIPDFSERATKSNILIPEVGTVKFLDLTGPTVFPS
jgi:uncharacterized protein YuzE